MSKPKTNDAVPDFAAGGGILPAIAQDSDTGDVLMLAYMNEAAFAETLATGRAVYYSRSRQRLWRKGEESGHVQTVEQVLVDCDADAILLKVRQQGAACHEGYRTCFFRQLQRDTDSSKSLQPGVAITVVQPRLVDPASVYGKPE